MAAIKTRRISVVLDMTAMCDVAFLLLAFFMLTAKMKPLEELVNPPSISIGTNCTDRDFNQINILINADNQAFVGFEDPKDRIAILERISKKWHLNLSNAEKKQFYANTSFGVSMNDLKLFLNNGKVSKGIPYDEKQNELFDWVLAARLVNPHVKVSIKGDKNADYEAIGKIINTLQSQNINTFRLINEVEVAGNNL